MHFPLKARSFAWYEGPIVKALLQLKYKPNRRLADLMADWLVEIHPGEQWPEALIVPVPLGQIRSRQRGYNQADLIASSLAHKLAMPYDTSVLWRERETNSQVGLSPTDRRRNVFGAFRAETRRLTGRPVLVVDDLFTTGSTLSSCAEALLSAGAASVFALTVARAESTDADRIR
ncbi:MAG: ComF family protein [Anaerolineales bacterium]|nr:ComF family protein [Anaerolineales bacterium]